MNFPAFLAWVSTFSAEDVQLFAYWKILVDFFIRIFKDFTYMFVSKR